MPSRTLRPTVLVTGFEPFGGDVLNPSAEVARRLDGRIIARHRVAGRVLPCTFGASRRELARWVRRLRPACVIGLGLAGGRAAITPERVAINVDDARIPDNAGAQPVDRPVVRGGPAAYWSTLPIKAIVAALQDRGIPAAVSQSAGTFVCNHTFYGLMHLLRRRRAVRAGFVHLPYVDEQQAAHPGAPSLPLDTLLEAIEVLIAVAVRQRKDCRIGGGSTH